MRVPASREGGFEPIETASVDELRALQLERLRWSLRHAYENVAHYRNAFDAAGVHPDDLASLDPLRWQQIAIARSIGPAVPNAVRRGSGLDGATQRLGRANREENQRHRGA